MLGHSGVTVLMCVCVYVEGGGVFSALISKLHQHFYSLPIMEVLILACLIRGLGVKPWDPSKLSSSVSLPNHMSGWDEETKHVFLFLLEHYPLTVRLPIPAQV